MINKNYNLTLRPFIRVFTILSIFALFFACEEDEVEPDLLPEYENSITYTLDETNDSEVNGYIVFGELDNGDIRADLFIEGTEAGNTHPAHIHANSIVETGDITIPLESVDGATGRSTTTITDLTYDELLDYDGHVNVHLSENDLTVVAQSDIGSNVLTGNSTSYDLDERDVEGISGSILFEERRNGSTKATITLEGTPEGGSHPAHIHMNTAVESGPIVVSFAEVDGTTGLSISDVEAFDDGTDLTYEEIIEYDGYVNVHLSPDELSTIVAQGDIGQNELTGNSTVYDLDEEDVEGISGTATLSERLNGETLVVIELEGTPDGGTHPAHIHMNTAAEGGGIVVSFNPVDGSTGISRTNVTNFDGEEGAPGDPVTYEDLIAYDGYINVHLSPEDLGTIVAQGDIGENVLTGESVVYDLAERDVPDISGTVTLFQRQSGNTLAVVDLEGTPEGGEHPAHIHRNTAAEGGGIVISFTPVDGTTGMSETTIRAFDDGTAVSYSDLLEYDGYVNVHLSDEDLGTIVAQGDIGENDLTGDSVSYALAAVGESGVSGSATFFERVNGTSLVVLDVEGTTAGNTHPAHIHFNSVEEGGRIAISLNNVDGATGMSRTQVDERDNNTEITYSELLEFDGHINIHLSPENLSTIVAQGNIGANAPE
ncbi:MAG: CHRD domain-containing protein [Cyclobacteriaceae bacterium]